MPFDSRHATSDFEAVLARAGLPRQRFHDLKHAFATLQIEGGAEMFEVIKVLGHSTTATTSAIYAHMTPAIGRRSADRMDDIVVSKRAVGGAG